MPIYQNFISFHTVTFMLFYDNLLGDPQLSHFGKAERCVGAPEAETVRQSDIDHFLLSRVGHIVAVKVFLGISRVLKIQCWRKNVLRLSVLNILIGVQN